MSGAQRYVVRMHPYYVKDIHGVANTSINSKVGHGYQQREAPGGVKWIGPLSWSLWMLTAYTHSFQSLSASLKCGYYFAIMATQFIADINLGIALDYYRVSGKRMKKVSADRFNFHFSTSPTRLLITSNRPSGVYSILDLRCSLCYSSRPQRTVPIFINFAWP